MTVNALPDGLLVAYYGDDFTGSTSVMEVMTFAGLPTVLFLDMPTDAQVARFAGYRSIGIAGVARSQTPAWMDAHLPPVFHKLAALGAPIAHYKVCSTFDSAPHVGSIGRAIETELSPHQREVLVAVALNGVPIDVLAERLSTTRGALYKTIHDARKKLRAHLGDAGLRFTDEAETAEATR